MKVTRERKIIGSVLILALGFLGYDQLGTSAAPGDEALADSGTLLMASTTTSNKAMLANYDDGASLASRLAATAQKTGTTSPQSIRDAFRPANGWIANSIDGTRVSAADKFAADHKLSTVSLNGTGGGVAVVDGKMLHIGATLEGYKLIAITRQSATFQSANGARAQLKLPVDPLASGR